MTEELKPISQPNSKENINEALIAEMVKAGLHWGHFKSKKHPKIKPYLFGVRNNICIIDVNKTVSALKKAIEFLKKIYDEKGVILFVGTKPAIQEIVKKTAENLGMPYVSKRWLGGTLTNFQTIRSRINRMEELLKKKAKGEFEGLTKKEKALIDEEIQEIEEKFGGLRSLKSLPQALFVVDIVAHVIAVEEAKKLNIPIVGIVDTNASPEEIEMPIPANDDAPSSVAWLLDKIQKGIKGEEIFNLKK